MNYQKNLFFRGFIIQTKLPTKKGAILFTERRFSEACENMG